MKAQQAKIHLSEMKKHMMSFVSHQNENPDSQSLEQETVKLSKEIFFKIKLMISHPEIVNEAIDSFLIIMDKDMTFFNNNIISPCLFDDYRQVKNSAEFLNKIDKVNVLRTKKIEINNQYIDKRKATKALYNMYTSSNKPEVFNNYYHNLCIMGLKIDASFIYASTLRSNACKNEEFFIYDHFLKKSPDKKIIENFMCFADEYNLNDNLNSIRERTVSGFGFKLPQNNKEYHAIMKTISDFHKLSQNEESLNLLRIKTYSQDVINNFLFNGSLRNDKEAIEQVKTNKFNPFVVYPELWEYIFINKNSHNFLSYFDNELIYNKNLFFETEKNIIENYLDNSRYSSNKEKVLSVDILSFIKNIETNPFEDKFGTGSFFNDLIKIIDKYSDKKTELNKKYIHITEIYLKKFNPETFYLDTKGLENTLWITYLEKRFLSLSLEDNKIMSNKVSTRI